MSSERCPAARPLHALGTGYDNIDVAAAPHLDGGISPHKILFRKKPPLLLTEDVNLGPNLRGLRRVLVTPLVVTGLDTSPCTVIAEIEQGSWSAQFGNHKLPRVFCPNR
jgi:hypothetical protein